MGSTYSHRQINEMLYLCYFWVITCQRWSLVVCFRTEVTWTQCDTQLTTHVNQEKPDGFYFVNSPAHCVCGRQSPFITGTSGRPPACRHHSDQFCRAELMSQHRNLKGEPQVCIYLLHLLHCSGHNSVLIAVYKITPFPSLFSLKRRFLTLSTECNSDID